MTLDEKIEALRLEAREVGDSEQEAICAHALAGNEEARRACAKLIAAVEAEASRDEASPSEEV